MTPLSVLTDLSRAAGLWMPILADAAIKGSVLLAGAAVAAALLRRSSAAGRQLVWCLALAGCLVMPVLHAALPAWRVLPGWATARMESQPTAANPAAGATAPGVWAERFTPIRPDEIQTGEPLSSVGVGTMAPAKGAAPVEPELVAPDPPRPAGRPDALSAEARPSRTAWVAPAIAALWAAGVLACLAPLALGRISLRRLARRATPIDDGAWSVLLHRASAALRLRRRVALLESPARSMPMIWGIFRATLLLPASAAEWSADRRWVVLLHELGHVKRCDCLVRFLSHAACAIYWFNPLAWWALRRISAEGERVCDDLVLAAGSHPADYARHVLEIASGLRLRRLAALSGTAMARPSRLEGRLRSILDPHRRTRALTRLGVLLIVAAFAATAVGVSVLGCRQAQPAVGDIKVAPVSQPPPEKVAGSSLSFRIAPQKALSGEFVSIPPTLQELYVAVLIHQGPGALVEQQVPYRWLPLRLAKDEKPNADLLTYVRDDVTYLLTCADEDLVMLPGGDKPWAVTRTYVTQDSSGQTAIWFQLDDRGAEQLARLTSKHLGDALALIVDGQVLSTPIIRAAISREGMITGRFTPEQARKLAQALAAGMAPAGEAPAPREERSSREPPGPGVATAVRRMITDAADTAAGETENDKALRQTLGRKVVQGSYSGAPLREVLGALEQAGGVKIAVSYTVLRNAGISLSTPVTVEFLNLSVDAALTRTLEAAAPGGKLTWRVRNGAVCVQ